MRSLFVGIFIGILLCIGTYYVHGLVASYIAAKRTVSPLSKILEKPLDKYTILALSGRRFSGNQIVLDEATATTSAYTVFTFHYMSDGSKVTGVAHVPVDATPTHKMPVIVQYRGFIDPANYVPGDGTRHSAEIFARNGFISLAPDFLGFGGSDKPSGDVFEERFQTYTTALNMFASVSTLTMADSARVAIWGHSNGGHIALTVAEILGKPIPMVLWAPVSKPFPYSILYYTDDAQDHGKLLRKELARFENDYDVELYSFTNYLDRIVSPVQLHQGTTDQAVPPAWSDLLAKTLKEKGKDITYFIYPGADHDMAGPPEGGWNTVVTRDIAFFRKYLQ